MPGQILVLVAEDEELVRLVIVEALEDAGFEVIEAGHADAALGVLQIHSAHSCAVYRYSDARRYGRSRPCASYREELAQNSATDYLGASPAGSGQSPQEKPVFGETVSAPPRHSPYSRARGGRMK
jgi:CheY-like chemotaxis protein